MEDEIRDILSFIKKYYGTEGWEVMKEVIDEMELEDEDDIEED